MDDVSDFFKSGFLSLHKNTFGKGYQQKTLRDRMNSLNNIRRETRNTLMFQKRNIAENMTPISTPDSSKILKIVDQKKKKPPNKRLEMLQKWKAEKEKRKQEEKQKLIAKPLFKVCHVPVDVGLPNLQNINKEIKGKPIKSNPTPIKSQFAPPNHKFRAPKNVKAIHFDNTSTTTKTNFIELNKRAAPEEKFANSQRNTRAATRALREDKKKITSIDKKSQVKPQTDKSSSKQTNSLIQKIDQVKPKGDKKTVIKPISKEEKVLGKNASNINTRKKVDGNINPPITSKIKITHDTASKFAYTPPKKNRTNEKTLVRQNSVDKSSVILANKSGKTFDQNINTRSKLTIAKIASAKDVSPDIEKTRTILKKQSPKLVKESSVRTPKKYRKSPIKSVGFNVIEIVESDEDVVCTEIDYKTPKKVAKKYNKTPKKREISEGIADIDLEVFKDENEIKTPGSLRNKRKSGIALEKNNLTANVDEDETVTYAAQNVIKVHKKTPRKEKRAGKPSHIEFEETLKNEDRREENTPVTPRNKRKSDAALEEDILAGDDDNAEIITNSTKKKALKNAKREYNKTPRKGQKSDISESKLEVFKNTNAEEKNTLITPKNNRKSHAAVIESRQNTYEDEEKETKADMKVISRNSTIGSATGSASPDYPIENIINTDLNTSLHTPVKSSTREVSPVYISPFVTISRGKSSARKEYHVRQSTDGSASNSTDFNNKDISNHTSPKAGADYFTRKLNHEIARIQNMCHEWNKYRDNNDVPEEANDMIDVAVGQSKLLISKKFQQFQCLLEQCRNSQYIEKPITCKDLHGFWDMIYMQVEDLNKRFNNLEVMKGNNWQEVVPEKKPVPKRGRGRPKKAAASSTLRNLIKAARDIKKSNMQEKLDVPPLIVPNPDEAKIFSGGYYSVKSPVRDQSVLSSRPSSARRSMRVSLLANQAKKRISASPGLTILRVSQAIKSRDGLTPSKSILKSDLTKSANRVTKSVLFKDNLEEDIEKNLKSSRTVLFKDTDDNGDKENDINNVNLIALSPVTPTRRSKRLSKIN